MTIDANSTTLPRGRLRCVFDAVVGFVTDPAPRGWRRMWVWSCVTLLLVVPLGILSNHVTRTDGILSVTLSFDGTKWVESQLDGADALQLEMSAACEINALGELRGVNHSFRRSGLTNVPDLESARPILLRRLQEDVPEVLHPYFHSTLSILGPYTGSARLSIFPSRVSSDFFVGALFLSLYVWLTIGFVRVSIERRLKRRLRLSDRECPDCRYSIDMQATAICPECGVNVSARIEELRRRIRV